MSDDTAILRILNAGKTLLRERGKRYTVESALYAAIYAVVEESMLLTLRSKIDLRRIEDSSKELAAQLAARVPDARRRIRERGK